MRRFSWIALGVLLWGASCKSPKPEIACEPASRDASLTAIDTLNKSLNWPEDLVITGFTGPKLTPSPACLAVAATGEVYVGVDMIGSLGKRPGRGRIMKLVDCDNDGIPDRSTEFAKVDNPRGIIALGDQVFVLHTTFKDTLASGMDLVLFEDKDGDGIADGAPQPLIQNISSTKFIQSRGTDHATNGIRMGIDGWIYIAVGDFGFHEAIDRDGTRLTMLGGGIVRVRPDGRELEIFSQGTRNIYDVAIDPYMNIFTLDNTNDGGGWNIRFSHQLQTAAYGYPMLFKNFTEEIIPAMVDLGGGSGTGSLFFQDPTWPEKYNNVPMMADWGRNQLYINRVTTADATFTQVQEEFIKMPQITDVDVDASGRMFISAWNGAGYSGDSTKGFVARVVPRNWTYKAFADPADASDSELQNLLKSASAVQRLVAQQELLRRSGSKAAKLSLPIAKDASLPLYARVAALFTYAQGAGEKAVDELLKLSEDSALKEYALKALTDRKSYVKNAPVAPFLAALKEGSPRERAAAIIGLNRLGNKEAISALLQVPVPESFVAPVKGQEGPHATPNPAIVHAHLAVKALVGLGAVNEAVAAIGGPHSKLALWALRYMHTPEAVSGLIKAYQASTDENLKREITTTLARLYQKEDAYDASWWWSTRPDTRGPYYKPVTWEASEEIRNFLTSLWQEKGATEKDWFAGLNTKFRMGIAEFGGEEVKEGVAEVKVDLNKIRNTKGQIGKSSIEDIMLAMDKIKGDPSIGKRLFVQQGCVACHSLEKGEPLKGPFMGQIGSIMTRQQIAESILKPNASISQGFATVLISAKDGKSYTGFVTSESSEKLTLRDITGASAVINVKDISSRKELPTSMMPPGLADALSYEEFASLITFLSQKKG